MDRKSLGELMDDRRLDLRMTWEEVAEATGITTETLRQIRAGNSQPRALTIRRIEDGLQWQPGSLASYLDGHLAAPLPAVRSAGAESAANKQLRKVIEAAEELPLGHPARAEAEAWRKYLEPPEEPLDQSYPERDAG